MAHQHPHPQPQPGQQGTPAPGQMQPLPPLPRLTPAQVRALTPQQKMQLQHLQRLHAERAAMIANAPPPPPLDPAMEAILDSSYRPVPLKFSDDERMSAVCAEHGEETCDRCGIDFGPLNELAGQIESLLGKDGVPPPAAQAVGGGQRTQRVTKAKDDGNTLFKKNQFAASIRLYTTAADFAAGRPPWEPNNLLREELSMCLGNRSAAYTADGDFESAIIDADAAIAFRRPWSKGHFRKARALTAAGRLQEAKEAIELGLKFDPDSEEMKKVVEEIDEAIAKEQVAPEA